MRYWLEDDMRPVELAREACRQIGIEPFSTPTRGGTDGSRLTELGVPTPNLFTGMQNIHGPLEWVSVQDMTRATEHVHHAGAAVGQAPARQRARPTGEGKTGAPVGRARSIGQASQPGADPRQMGGGEMATPAAIPDEGGQGGLTQRMLDGIERVGNKVPHPVMMFLYLIILVIVLSHVLYLMGVSVTEQIAEPVPVIDAAGLLRGHLASPASRRPDAEPDFVINEQTVAIQEPAHDRRHPLHLHSFVTNFQGFGVVAVTFVAMIGVGVAEQAGMMAALIRKLVQVAPRQVCSPSSSCSSACSPASPPTPAT